MNICCHDSPELIRETAQWRTVRCKQCGLECYIHQRRGALTSDDMTEALQDKDMDNERRQREDQDY